MAKTEIKFEEALKYLEDAANKLKSGNLSLEESVNVYEDSIEYYNFCSDFINNAKQKIEMYRPEDNSIEDIKGEF